MPVIKIKKNSLPKAQFGPPFSFNQGLAQAIQKIEQNAPIEDAKAGRLADQTYYNPFDVKWGQRQDPQIDITGSQSNKPFDPYATSSGTSSFPMSKPGTLNLPQLVNTNLLSKDKPKKKTSNSSNFGNNLIKAGRWSGVGLGLLSAGVDYFDDKQKQKEWDSWSRKQGLPDNMYAVSPGNDRGDFDINEGIYRPNQLTPPNIGSASVAQYGGTQSSEDMNLVKIRLRQPMMKYGGQSGLGMGLDIGQRRVYTHMPKDKDQRVSDRLNPIPRDQANIEAEKGETAYGDMDGDGALEHFVIGGKRHSEGGTPLNVPEGSFIFSDTKKMIIKDPEVLREFGMAFRKEGYTPAEIAKKYDVNKYKAIMEDPNMDQVRKSTAQLMIKNFQKKLGKLALIQESMKGFPQGVPEVALQTVPEAAMIQESLQQTQNFEQGMDEETENQDMEAQEQVQQEDEMGQEMPEAEYGGLPKHQTKGQVSDRFPVWSPEYQDIISGYIKDKYDVKMPINARDAQDPNRFTLPSMQSSRGGKRVYGEEDWTDQQHMADFAERQADFIKENPNWDPTKKGSTKQFQEWYNKKATELGLPQYFGQGNKFQGLDDKFGEYTFSAPSLSRKPADNETGLTGYVCKGRDPNTGKANIQSSSYRDANSMMAAGAVSSPTEAEKQCPETTLTTTIPPGTTGEKPKPGPYGWMTPDVVNLAAAAAISPKKRLPYIAGAQYEPSRLSLEDWRAQAATRQAMYNKQAEVMGVYGPTTGQGAAQSSAAGQQAEALAGDIAGVTSRNVDRVNQFLQQERQRKDQFNLLGANRATELYKGNVIANQQYDNSMREYINNMAKTFGQGWKNASQLGMLNAVNPFYKVNPYSGRSYFTGRGYNTDMLGQGSSGGGGDFAAINAAYNKAKAQLPDLTLDKFLEMTGMGSATAGRGSGSSYRDAAAFLPMYQAGMFG
jgi:hypothetical protein